MIYFKKHSIEYIARNIWLVMIRENYLEDRQHSNLNFDEDKTPETSPPKDNIEPLSQSKLPIIPKTLNDIPKLKLPEKSPLVIAPNVVDLTIERKCNYKRLQRIICEKRRFKSRIIGKNLSLPRLYAVYLRKTMGGKKSEIEKAQAEALYELIDSELGNHKIRKFPLQFGTENNENMNNESKEIGRAHV